MKGSFVLLVKNSFEAISRRRAALPVNHQQPNYAADRVGSSMFADNENEHTKLEWAVSRILSPAMRVMIIYLGCRSPGTSSNLPGNLGRAALERFPI